MFDLNLFNSVLAFRGISKKELASKIGLSETTIYKKINRNGDFSREEIQKIGNIIGKENAKAIFFADELTQMQETDAH